MSDLVHTGSGPVRVDYHHYLVYDPEAPVTEDELDVSHNGLIALSDGQVEIQTGIHSGNAQVTVAAHRTTPDADPGPWQEIVEVSVHTPSGELLIGALMDDMEEELPSLAASGPGDYRLRVHARGRDTAVDLTTREITEHYLIQGWPVAPTPPLTLSTGDRDGAQQRSSTPLSAPVTSGPARGQSARERDILHRSLRDEES
ncbi:hypothetical protein F7R91_24945 [Streptomyces luteolifulvus]|uniref:Uncharacterized protein n=1 Tax=Streptomyces luteolifulvus TaxID=2615112 RepID=A0A6H9UUC8_9ACTN|nr:hypothetical protein [Streptomyces luteolifulvus]KAB1143435.1 hypothetical protein F7R91_24945 [Streptomyces luteolifulvus]